MRKFCVLCLALGFLSLAAKALAVPEAPTMSYETNGINITVSWSEVQGATGYKLYYAPAPYEGEHTIGHMDMEGETSFSIDLWDGAAYYVAVKSYDPNEESNYSNIEVFKVISGIISYSDTPTLNESLTVNFETDYRAEELSWQIENLPTDSVTTLSISSDGLSAQLTPDAVGYYTLSLHSADGIFERTTSFNIRNVFEFEPRNIVGNDGSLSIDEIVGKITNQSWVFSEASSESTLRNIVSQYGEFTIVGFDEIQGLLIEYDVDAVESTSALEALSQESGVTSVLNRVYVGKYGPDLYTIPPDDGSSFYDGGDNWHLEEIDAVTAWNVTVGAPDILVGVSDGGYDISHPEFSGRVSELLTQETHFHGNGVAGAIGALTDNGFGISGINWKSPMVLGHMHDSLNLLLDKPSLSLCNCSWGYHIDTSFDPSDALSVSSREDFIHNVTRYYRRLAPSYPEKLLVWAAGNGIGNGLGNSAGVYGVDGRFEMPAMHYDDNWDIDKIGNVVMVAAMRGSEHLTYYSSYGESVDLAAPSHFKSLDVGNGYLSSFTGTSAAAPVVTGVASLIYSINPDFTGEEVKNILVESATEYVYERYKNPQSQTETLQQPIPILNAGNALRMAQEIVENDTDRDGDGYLSKDGDCNDAEASINPGATDICDDEIDQDCSGSDEVCPVGPNDVDDDNDGYTENQGDCNDAEASINPGATDICDDEIDQDCSGSDEVCPTDPNSHINIAEYSALNNVSRWDYRWTEDGQTNNWSVVNQGVISKNSKSVNLLQEYDEGNHPNDQEFILSDFSEGLFIFGGLNDYGDPSQEEWFLTPEMPYLLESFVPGRTYTYNHYESRMGSGPWNLTIVPETVTVPAGTYSDCLKATIVRSYNEGTGTDIRWYAKGVGLVKRYQSDPGGVSTWELTEAVQIPTVIDTLSYYNFEVGNSWSYDGSMLEYYGTNFPWNTTRTVTGTDSLYGLSCYTMTEPDRFKTQINRTCYDDQYIYINDGESLPTHKRYVELGQTYSYVLSSFGLNVTSQVYQGTVSTPAYTGEALIIQNTYSGNAAYSWIETIYLVENIGLVKTVNSDNDGNYIYQNRYLTGTSF